MLSAWHFTNNPIPPSPNAILTQNNWPLIESNLDASSFCSRDEPLFDQLRVDLFFACDPLVSSSLLISAHSPIPSLAYLVSRDLGYFFQMRFVYSDSYFLRHLISIESHG